MLQIQRLSLEKQIVELRAKGLSNREIAKEFGKQGIKVSHMGVSRFLNSSKKVEKTIISEKKELREELARQKLDIYQQVIDAIKLVKRKIDDLEKTNEHYALQGYLKEFRSQLEFVAKMVGELDPKISIKQTITYVRSNIIEIINEMPEQAKKDLAQFLIENKLIDNLTTASLINDGLRGIEKLGYCMIKINDEDTRTSIKHLEEKGKLSIFKSAQ